MSMIALFPVAVSLIGLIVYLLASNPKASECGRLAFFAGLLVCCFVFAQSTGISVRMGANDGQPRRIDDPNLVPAALWFP